MIYNFLFPTKPDNKNISVLLLTLRIVFGVLLMSHGIQKLCNFHELSNVFPDPIGLGSSVSLILAIFAEFLCSAAFVIGILYRLATIPMIFTMGVAFFVAHAHDSFSVKELAFVYFVVFIILYIVGPGKYSVDYAIGKELRRRKDQKNKIK